MNTIELNGKTYCPYCGKEINGECNCSDAHAYVDVITQQKALNAQINFLKQMLPKEKYYVDNDKIVPIPPAEDDGGEENTEGGE